MCVNRRLYVVFHHIAIRVMNYEQYPFLWVDLNKYAVLFVCVYRRLYVVRCGVGLYWYDLVGRVETIR